MGCSSSKPFGFNHDAEVLRATKQHFRLGELPVSVKAHAKGGGIEVQAVGLAQVGLMASLEQAFHRRHFWIVDATANAMSGICRATFELKPFQDGEAEDEGREGASFEADTVVDATMLQGSSSPFPVSEAEIGSAVTMVSTATLGGSGHAVRLDAGMLEDTRTKTPKELAKVDARAAQNGAIVRLTIVQEWSPYVRPAIMQKVNADGFRMVLARLSVARSRRRRTIKDVLWLARIDNGEMVSPGTSLDGCSQWVSELRAFLQEGPDQMETALSTRSFKEMLPIENEIESEQVKRVSELPEPLHEVARGLPYYLHITEAGVQFDGFQKFCGAGMNTTVLEGDDVLEFSTYYIRAKDEACKPSSWIPGRRGAEVYAEFVTQYHPEKRRLTVFKVFLNGVLPPGQRAGVRATAEQLLAVPVPGSLVSWDGSAALCGLRELHLCDVVNWNTYVLMSKVGQEPASDVERWLLTDELRAVGLTLQDLKTKPAEAIFARTALGKLIHGMLAQWRQGGVREHKVKTVRVAFNFEHSENINGEMRPAMDVVAVLAETPLVQQRL
mmetsp:Transcript_41818/g.116638  ORF Transcript_41818/g.116638 Transcript_41818/m.116638 type:complete len:555 (-) Transcript_41818:127-1791(-)